MSPVLWLCFALSGAAALALELLWMRSACLVAGSTAATTAAVLACYFAGLGFGSVFGRTVPRRPVRFYGRLELAAALAALWSAVVFRAAGSEAAQRFLDAGGASFRVAWIAAAILPATFALGATLPTLAEVLATPASVGSRGALLYSLNTLGGAVGILAMGFGVPALIGVKLSYAAVAMTSAVAGGLALWVGDSPASLREPVARGDTRPALRLRFVSAACGFLAIGIEVLWTRLFAQVLHNSVYSFAAVSLAFLLAIVAGAAMAAWGLRRISPAKVAAACLAMSALFSVTGLGIFVRWTDGLGYFGMNSGLAEYVLRIVVLAAVTAGPAALAAAGVLPALWAADDDRLSVARPVAELTAANLFGGALGAIVAGFVVLPLLGMRTAFALAALAYVVLADLVGGGDARLRAVGYAAVVLVVLLDPLHVLSHLRSGESLRASAEGASGIVTVVDTGDDLQLRLDNFYVLGGSAAAQGERRLGLLPLLLHPAPRRAAFVGMATGISAGAAPALGVESTKVIEVVPEVASLAAEYFSPWNGDLLAQPGVSLVVDDGRRYLAATTENFDVIVSDLFIPWHAGAGSLYAAEMFSTVARRLAPGGLFCQWLPLYQLTREEFAIIVGTFATVFPHVTLWRNDFYPDRPVVGLVGSFEPLAVDLDAASSRLGTLPDWARDSFLAGRRALAMLYLGDAAAMPSDSAGASADVLNTDDHPVIEFLAPRLTRMNANGDKDWFTGTALADFADELASHSPLTAAPFVQRGSELDDARRAGTALFRYAIAARSGDTDAAARYQGEVQQLVPEVVAAGEEGSPQAVLEDARRTLGDLKSEQQMLRRQLEAMEQRLPK